jgi:hypothetical protein
LQAIDAIPVNNLLGPLRAARLGPPPRAKRDCAWPLPTASSPPETARGR